MGQLCFELIKMQTQSEYLSREHFSDFIDRIVQMNEQQIQSFYARTEIDPRAPINKGKDIKSKYNKTLYLLLFIEEFVSNFKKVANLPLFTWVPHLVDGYNKEGMNIDEEYHSKAGELQRKLTTISNDRVRNETETMGFTSDEYDSMQEFFNAELKKSDAKEVLRVISLIFKDIRQNKMKRYFIEALTKHVS